MKFQKQSMKYCFWCPEHAEQAFFSSILSTDIQGRSQTSCNGLISHGVQTGSFGIFANHGQKEMRPQSLRAVRHYIRVYLHAQTAVDADDIHTWQLMEKKKKKKTKSPNLSSMWG